MERYGWYEYSREKQWIRNVLSGQVVHVERLHHANGKIDYRGDYQDAELRCSVYFAHGKRAHGILIEVDYARSFATPPTYGCWRRVDDFLSDALLAWPMTLGDGMTAVTVTTRGGWWQGQWRPAREHSRSTRLAPRQQTDAPLATPWLIPLDAAPPAAWHLADHDNPAREVSLSFEHRPGTRFCHLPADAPVTGFQGQVPYLERADGKGFLSFAQIAPGMGGHAGPIEMYYLYVDEAVFFRFRTENGIDTGSVFHYGFRQLHPAPEWWGQNCSGSPHAPDAPSREHDARAICSYLPYRVWLNFVHTLCEAWPMWGVPCEISLDPASALPDWQRDAVGFIGQRKWIKGGFIAGMPNLWLSQEAA